MALRERLIKDNGFSSTVLGDDSVSNQQSFQDMKARLHRLLINRMDLTKMRMLEPEQLLEEVIASFQSKVLIGKRILISAGPTFEPIDPVRGLTNPSSGKMGYAMARAHWGNGYMGEVLPAMVSHAFGAFGLHRLEADVDPRNAASVRALERIGFRLEGHLRERYHVNGEAQDALLYGLLRREWAG